MVVVERIAALVVTLNTKLLHRGGKTGAKRLPVAASEKWREHVCGGRQCGRCAGRCAGEQAAVQTRERVCAHSARARPGGGCRV